MSLVAVGLAVLVGAALQSALGFGFALITAPALFAVMAPGGALTILAFMSGLLSLLVLFAEGRDVQVAWHPVTRLLAWSLPGLVAGVLILRAVDKPVLQVGVGLAVMAAALSDARAAAAGAAALPWPVAPVGLAAGAMTTTTGVNGPPMLMYFLRSGIDPHRIRDSMAAAFLLFSPLAVVALAVGGRLGLGDVGVVELAALLAVVAVGRPLGRMLFERLDARSFRIVGVALAVVAGAASVVAGLTG